MTKDERKKWGKVAGRREEDEWLTDKRNVVWGFGIKDVESSIKQLIQQCLKL